MTITIICHQCRAEYEAMAGHINRAKKTGARMFCSRACAGLSRRLKNPLTEAERKEAKRLYDAQRRKEKHAEICKQKMDHYYANRDRFLKEHAEYRAKHVDRHIAYCRRPEYRKWKAGYDRRYLAKKAFGDFADAALLVRDLEKELDSRMSPHERRMTNGTINKAQMRRRAL